MVSVLAVEYVEYQGITQAVVICPLSLSVAELFCKSLPVVESNRVIALSVDEAGHTTSPVPPLALAITKAVVAICVVFVAGAAVGAVGVPVSAGEARGALASRAA